MSNILFLFKTIGGGIGCFVLGFILLGIPGVEWWRAIAAFPLGAIFIGLGWHHWVHSQVENNGEDH